MTGVAAVVPRTPFPPQPTSNVDAHHRLTCAGSAPQQVVTRGRGPLSAHSGAVSEVEPPSPASPSVGARVKAEFGSGRLPPHSASLKAASEEPRSDVVGGGTAGSSSSPSRDGDGSGGSRGSGSGGGSADVGGGGGGGGNLTLAERKKRNRESAERSRLRRLAHLGKVQSALGAARSENNALRVQVALAHQRIRYLEYVVEAQGGVGVLPPQVLTSPLQRLWEGDEQAVATLAATATAAAERVGGALPIGGCTRMPAAIHGGGLSQ